MKEESDATVVCCSFPAGNLLFYKLSLDGLDGFKVEVHPNFNFTLSDCNSLPNSLVLDDIDLEILAYAITAARPLVSNSTLYWFTNDLHYLYGYDFSKEKWFRSTSLKQDLFRSTSWEREIHRESPVPVLVELSSTSFLVIALLSSGKLGVASLSVYKTTDTLDVSVGACQIISVDPYFLPRDGMVAIAVDSVEEPVKKKGSTIKDERPQRMKGQSPHASCEKEMQLE
ncbi:uncharacterized protein LOC107811653 isoform X1 [Nicotiana tabacum]|uniref:Uncharacterized protein LOC107811653 isoform X1 n=1 Tax=Nicotiana tabacum TaxID=4097 RepID=A0A1S4BT92_TOBAC|nr:PREDICTED: uncharacterized protein LOC107811653 isoform X1 [Nicotiana tabacum]